MTGAMIPNFTQIPDYILDYLMGVLSGAEFKVVMYVARRTYGFGKKSDRISLNQMASGIRRHDGTVLDMGTGQSRSTIKTACAALIKRRILLRTCNANRATGEFSESTYRLNLELVAEEAAKELGRVPAHVGRMPRDHVGRKSAQVGRNTGSEVGRNPAQQETELKQDTAAADKDSNAAAELMERLVAAGLNPDDAARFATNRPEECERQLTYHRYREETGFEFRRSRGGFLSSAIKGRFRPPDGFEKRQEAIRTGEATRTRQEAEAARERAVKDELRERLARLRNDEPETYARYRQYVEIKKQDAASRPILNATSTLRQRLIASFDTEEVCLQLLSEFLADQSLPYATHLIPRSFDGSSRIIGSTSSRKPS